MAPPPPPPLHRAAASGSALPKPQTDFVVKRGGPLRFHSPWPQTQGTVSAGGASLKPIMARLCARAVHASKLAKSTRRAVALRES